MGSDACVEAGSGLGECCVCYDDRVLLRALPCRHPVCVTCVRRLRGSECPMCRADLGMEVAAERQLVRVNRRLSYVFDFQVPMIKRDGVVETPPRFSVDHYPEGCGRDFEAAVPPEDLRAAISRLNAAAAAAASAPSASSASSAAATTRCGCAEGLSQLVAAVAARRRVLAALRRQNREWKAAGVACAFALADSSSSTWSLEGATLFVQWDPDRDVMYD
eukprot:TRINITY_DN17547_c7_g1_i1.p1 TRINITY_DN17547_c7_g1~~TRINITY_DN17547_c7_g1_i1.p1  ORF type:complete len:219 (-),score=43.32 TRINITY_DN17547_c7_g1_i1:52-708(-)